MNISKLRLGGDSSQFWKVINRPKLNAVGSSTVIYLDKVESDSGEIINHPKQVAELINAYLISVQDQGDSSHSTKWPLMSGWCCFAIAVNLKSWTSKIK